ncbi:MAG: hypothetical protein RL328_581, partial [Acidobacteriota bacterium]
ITSATLAQNSAVEAAAKKFVPGVTWKVGSVVAADFTCHGRKESAILGLTESNIVIAVFVNGTDSRPEILRYSAQARDPKTAKLSLEGSDYDPKAVIGEELEGFKRSKTCKGLNLSDGKIDSAHIYWNHLKNHFEAWSL